jgi:hypothetical protein
LDSPHILEPGQRVFIEKNIPGFSESRWEITPVGSAASQRIFLRLREKSGKGQSFILVLWDSKDEDWPRFLSIPVELSGRIPFLPRIFASDSSLGLILEEDLGGQTLKRHIESVADDRAAREKTYRRVLDALTEWQSLERTTSPTIAARAMDYHAFLRESGYFAIHCAVGLCGCGSMLDALWETDRRECAKAAAELPRSFLHRDFQSENILLHGEEIRFVDFQGARLGPPGYDVASLLLDPYIGALDEETVRDLFGYYASLPLHPPCNHHGFYLCAAQRLMQALGAYGNLSINKGKSRYRQFVPLALSRLQKIMKKLPEYGGIAKVVDACAESVGKDKFLGIQ